MSKLRIVDLEKRSATQSYHGNSVDQLPLEQIRALEVEIARNVATARQEARRLIAEAQRQACDLVRQAQEAGYTEGQAHYENDMQMARVAAAAVLAHAQEQAEAFRRKGERLLDTLIAYAVQNLITPAPEGTTTERSEP